MIRVLIYALGILNWAFMNETNWRITGIGMLLSIVFALIFLRGGDETWQKEK